MCMSDWDDNNFSGTDWDGDGIDWFDYEFDKQVYQNSFSSQRRQNSMPKKQEGVSGKTILLWMAVIGVILGILIPPLGAFMLLSLWLGGFITLMGWVFK